jgi:hypothetical protein
MNEERSAANASDLSTAALLDEVGTYIRRYVFLGEKASTVIALFVLHTHVLDAAEVTPYLAVTSAERRSGKTRLLDVLELLVGKPWRAVAPSEAVVFRKIERDQPTLLLDEVDTIFGPRASRDYEGLRALLNAGNQRGTRVPRCVGPNHELRDFAVFTPKVIAGIGELPDTVADRSVPIRMLRKAPGDAVARFKRREVVPEANSLKARIEEWGQRTVDELKEARPVLPDVLNDRTQDAVEPLLAIADCAGPEWARRARAAITAVCTSEESAESHGTRLLEDIRAAFALVQMDRLPTATLLELLASFEEAPWRDWRGQGLTPDKLSRLLAPYRVRPKAIRLADGTTPRGYMREQFWDAWRRYLPERETGATDETSISSDLLGGTPTQPPPLTSVPRGAARLSEGEDTVSRPPRDQEV